VGHATVAAHAVLMALGRRAVGVCRQHSGTGIIEVTAQIQQRATAPETIIEFRQSAPELDAPLPFKTTLRVAEALKLPATQLHEIMPARIARKGGSRLLVPISNHRHLQNLTPNFDTLISLGAELKTDGFFLFGVNRDSDEIGTESRMFCPALGIMEDPVSGNAHAMLGAYLWDLGQFAKKSTTFIGRQGYQMGRPGQVKVRLEIEKGSLIAARIAGTAIIVSEGTLAL
jgi:trans-2,3-dihydro-3-hydroxyanthranilate isomerase